MKIDSSLTSLRHAMVFALIASLLFGYGSVARPDADGGDTNERMTEIAAMTDRDALATLEYDADHNVGQMAQLRLFLTDPMVEARLGRTQTTVRRSVFQVQYTPAVGQASGRVSIPVIEEGITIEVSGGKLGTAQSETWETPYRGIISDTGLRPAVVDIEPLIAKLLKDFSQAELATLSTIGLDGPVREAAIPLVTDQAVLAEIARDGSLPPGVREGAVRNRNLVDQLLIAKIAQDTGSDSGVRIAATAKLSDQAVLAKIAQDRGSDSGVRIAATAKLSDQAVLAKIAQDRGSDPGVRIAATAKLSDQVVLDTIAQDVSDTSGVRVAAVANVADQALLERLADGNSAVSSLVEDVAKQRVAALKTGSTPLIDAVRDQDHGRVESLIAEGANPNEKDNDGETALIAAASKNDVDCVMALIAAGADVDARDKGGETALGVAGADSIAALEAARGADATVGKTELMTAAEAGNTEQVNALIAAGANVSSRDSDGNTALSIAACGSHADCVGALISAHADVNGPGWHGKSPLFLASEAGCMDSVRLLIAAHADASAKDDDGGTALVSAVREGRLDIVQALIAGGADVNAVDVHVKPLVDASRLADDDDWVKVLIVQDDDGSTALMAAVQERRLDIVRALIAGGADVNAKNLDGATALLQVVRNLDSWGSQESLDALIAAGGDINARDNSGYTALMMDAHAEHLSALVRAGANVNAKDNHGHTALMFAASFDEPKYLNALIRAGADVNAKDDKGQTALMLAVRFGWTDSVRAFIHAHADVNSKDNDGNTALMLAGSDDDEIVAMLRKAGARE